MWALSEVEGMVEKAARGAGIPLGHAQDLGRVASYLAATGSQVTPITDALQENPSQVDVIWGHAEITVVTGPAAMIGPIIRDAFDMGFEKATLADITQAPLVAAFLAANGMAQKWTGPVVSMSDTSVLKPKCKHVMIPMDDWQVWNDLAAKTYVPQSKASRLAGAGAGLTDND
jgi:hypothetical protein